MTSNQPVYGDDISKLSRVATIMTGLHRWLCFSQVNAKSRLGKEPAIVLAAHYNGLLDGFVYSMLSTQMLGVISAQWHQTSIGRILFPGIAVMRSKDRRKGAASTSNVTAFKSMINALRSGNSLLYFPEGTSRLGIQRLPVQRGTELLLRMARSEIPEVPVYFVAANYDSPTTWRSQTVIEIDGPHQIPDNKRILSEWVSAGLLRAQNKSLTHMFSRRSSMLELPRRLIAIVALIPIAPAFISAYWAIHNMADDTNVISLWRMLGGVPVALLCWLIWMVVAFVIGLPWLAMVIPVLTLIGVALWRS